MGEPRRLLWQPCLPLHGGAQRVDVVAGRETVHGKGAIVTNEDLEYCGVHAHGPARMGHEERAVRLEDVTLWCACIFAASAPRRVNAAHVGYNQGSYGLSSNEDLHSGEIIPGEVACVCGGGWGA